MKVTTTPKYIKDLKKFTIAIDEIDDVKKKNYYQKILSEFQAKAKIIDETHSSFGGGKIQPRIIRENIKELAEIRYQLQQLLKN